MHSAFVASVSQRVLAVIGEPESDLPAIVGDVAVFVEPARRLLTGGKRSRAVLAGLGWACGRPDSEWNEDAIQLAGSALELFQAAALVHDDIIDDADTRRGQPAAHRHFAGRHTDAGLRGPSDTFGVNAAILLGDLLLALAQRELSRAVATAPVAGSAAERVWNHMCAEVAIGQFLDIEAATLPLPSEGDDAAHTAALERSLAVLRHKSAQYSVAHPLALGAALALGEDAPFAALAAVGEPLGEAFQLRDDDLGVFGDPAVTGKPAGDDLIEGKRTPLVLLGLAHTRGAERARVLASLGHRGLTQPEVAGVREILTRSGAVAAHEAMIDERRTAALRAVDALGVAPRVTEQLREVVERLSTRDS
nr:polyprenyl synthetase family protein [Actinomycetales bacterium]